jgi:putative flippase GtrA
MVSKGRALIVEFLRFNLVGIGTIITGTCVFLGLIMMNVSYPLALLADYGAGILFSYFMHKHFTFRVKLASDSRSLAMTTISYLVSFLLNFLLLVFAVEHLALPVIPAQIGIMSLLALINFLMFKFIIFGVMIGAHDKPSTALLTPGKSRDV